MEISSQNYIRQSLDINSCPPNHAVDVSGLSFGGIADAISGITSTIFSKNDSQSKLQSCYSRTAIEFLENGIYSTIDCQIDDNEFNGISPLHLAVINGHQLSLDAILQAYKNSPKTSSYLERQIPGIGNLVHLAILYNQYGALEHLLTQYWDLVAPQLHQENDRGETPLMLAARLGNARLIHLLYTKNVDLEQQNSKGQRAIHFAAMANHEQAFVLLHYYGVGMTVMDQQEMLPIHYLRRSIEADPNYTSRMEKQRSLELFKFLATQQQEATRAAEKVDWLSHPPENLVFQGGGPKGIAYMGALRVLEEHGLLGDLKRVGGTSAGAIQATLLATNYKSEEMIAAFNSIDPKEFMDHPVLKTLALGSVNKIGSAVKEASKVVAEAGLEKISQADLTDTVNAFKDVHKLYQKLTSLVSDASAPADIKTTTAAFIKGLAKLRKTTGFCSGDVFREWLDEKIAIKAALALGKSPEDCRYLTFGELRTEFIDKGIPGYRHLYLKTTQMRKVNGEVFAAPITISSEDSRWDRVIISDAVRASMSIPGIFVPHTLHVQPETISPGVFDAQQRVAMRNKAESFGQFVDGGLIANYPIDLFDYEKYISSSRAENGLNSKTNLRTLGLANHCEPGQAPEEQPASMIGDLFLGVMNMLSTGAGLNVITDAVKVLGGSNGEYALSTIDSIKELVTSDGEKIDTADDVISAITGVYANSEAYHLSKNRMNKERTISINNLGVALWDFRTDPIPLLVSGEDTVSKAVDTFTAKEGPFDRHLIQEAIGAKPPLKYPSHLMQFTDNMEVLRDKLLQESDKQSSRKVVLWGEGSEKQEMAIAFRNRYANDFSRAVWITPDNERHLYQALAKSLLIDFTPAMSLEELRSQVHTALERNQEKRPYLLIFEGFQEMPSLPQGDNGRFLILADEKPVDDADVLHPPFLTEAEREYLQENYFKEIFSRLHNPNCEKTDCWNLDERQLDPKEQRAIDVINDEYFVYRWLYNPSFKQSQECLRLNANDSRDKSLFLSTEMAAGRALDPEVYADLLRELNKTTDLKYKSLKSYKEICHEIRSASTLGKISDIFIQADKERLVSNAERNGILVPDRINPFSECYASSYTEEKPKVNWLD